jgi:Na+/H+ antiporter NhaD/arsenite permease-like protein
MKLPGLLDLPFSKESVFTFLCLILSGNAVAGEVTSTDTLDLTAHPVGYLSILILIIAYIFVTAGEFTRLRKSKPVILEAGIIWAIVVIVPFDVFNKIARAEWDTLLFFCGVVMCIGGPGYIGYLTYVSEFMYTGWGATNANIGVGILPAFVANIPVMFAVLTMNPDMPLGQWLLVTLTAGVGGGLLSIGSAAGVALMGRAHGKIHALQSSALDACYRIGVCRKYCCSYVN